MRVAGIIYLHDITLTRMHSTALKDLSMFVNICGDEALRNVVLGTTKWDNVVLEEGQGREQELRNRYWRKMVHQGSVIMRVHADSSSAWEIIHHILKNNKVEFLRIQEELLELQKVTPDTDAGRTLRHWLERCREELEQIRKRLLAEERAANMEDGLEAKLEEIRQRIRETTDEIEKLRVPLSERIERFFGLRSGVSQV